MTALDRTQQIETHGEVPDRSDIDLAERSILVERAASAVKQGVQLSELPLGGCH